MTRAASLSKLRLVPRDDEAEPLFWLARARRILSPNPVERDAALALHHAPPALVAIPTILDDKRG
jgi:hypothetical protein